MRQNKSLQEISRDIDTFNTAVADATHAAHMAHIRAHTHTHAHAHGSGATERRSTGNASTHCSCIKYIDVTEFTREALVDPALIAADGLHPSARDYARWAKKAQEEILLHIRSII